MCPRAWKTLCLLTFTAIPVIAQPGPRDNRDDSNGPPPFGQRDGRGNPTGQIKEALAVSDDQWKSLEPKIARVLELQHDANPMAMASGPGMPGGPGMMGMPMARGGRGGPGGGGPNGDGPGGRPPRNGNGPTSRPARDGGPTSRPSRGPGGPGGGPPPGAAHRSAVQDRLDDLQEALDDKNARNDVLKAKIDAYHQARDQARGELAKARRELRESLNPTQEATLIAMNLLD